MEDQSNTPNIDFEKSGGLVPVVVQDVQTLEVLMVGYMNAEAYHETMEKGLVTFFSRSKGRLWTKGEHSNNFLKVESLHIDCDNDSILIKATPAGPTCHTGARSCFDTEYNQNFILELERIVEQRRESGNVESYVNKLRSKGLNKVAQKVGEEGVETVIAALAETEEAFIGEASDLVFHLIMLVKEKNLALTDIAACLELRHNARK